MNTILEKLSVSFFSLLTTKGIRIVKLACVVEAYFGNNPIPSNFVEVFIYTCYFNPYNFGLILSFRQ